LRIAKLALEEATMSSNGPYPGPPSHPWSGGSSDEPYTAPADPWGDQPTPAGGGAAWGDHPTSIPPSVESSVGYPQAYGAEALNAAPPAWGTPQPPPPRRRNTPIVALVAVLGLLILGGLGTTAWLLVNRDHPDANGVLPAATKPTSPGNVVGPQPSADARFVKKGECVSNEGTTQNPSMAIVPCASGTYQVLKRVDGKTTGEADAESKCSKVSNYTKWYFYDSELDSLDFVLCLREH
jgi:hypothetical protein